MSCDIDTNNPDMQNALDAAEKHAAKAKDSYLKDFLGERTNSNETNSFALSKVTRGAGT